MTLISTLTSPTQRVVVVAPHGELTVADVSSLREALRAATGGPQLLVVDLLDVPLVDDAVVEVLVGAAARCRASGVRFVVANANRQPWCSLTQARCAGVVRAHRRGSAPLSDVLQLLDV